MAAVSLVSICFSGAYAETVGVSSEVSYEEQESCAEGFMNSFGIGMQDDLNGWDPDNGQFGIGMQDDLNGWDPDNGQFGIGMQDDLNRWDPENGQFGIGMQDDLNGYEYGNVTE